MGPSESICEQRGCALAGCSQAHAVVPPFLLEGRQLLYLGQRFVVTGDLSP